jgi:hypothetical protein
MKTKHMQTKTTRIQPKPTSVSKQSGVVVRAPPIWMQVIINDIKTVFLIAKDKIPTPNKPKPESWDDWADCFPRK